MISDETIGLQSFTQNNNVLDLTLDNVRLAETVYSILNRRGNQQLEDLYASLSVNYSYDSIYSIIDLINKLNNTHLRNASEKPAISNMIIEECPDLDSLKERLIERNNENQFTHSLVSSIRSLSNDDSGVRDNYSFATKFCHYSCYYLFDSEEYEIATRDLYRDLYPIYDSIVSRYIKDTYNIEDNFDDYEVYVSAIDRIIGESNISRNGFDHLVWLNNR